MVSAVRTTKESWSLNANQGKFLRVITISTAKQVLKREQAKGTFPRTGYVRLVDGRRQPEEMVRFGGRIIYTQPDAVMAEAVEWIYQRLAEASPIGLRGRHKNYPPPWRGEHYTDKHVIISKGKGIIHHGGRDFIVVPATKQKLIEGTIVFVNPMPYARRIEHGAGVDIRFRGMKGRALKQAKRRSKKRALWSDQAPNGVYRLVAHKARQKFGKSLTVTYVRTQLRGLGYQFKHRPGNSKKTSLVHQFYPSILVTPK